MSVILLPALVYTPVSEARVFARDSGELFQGRVHACPDIAMVACKRVTHNRL